MKLLNQIQFSILLFLLSQLTFAGNLFSFKNNDTNLIINTTIPGHTYTQAGIKLLNPSFSIEGAGVECANAPSGYCTFTVSDTQNKILTINGPLGSYQFNLCLDAVNQISCQRYGSAGVVAEKFAFIGNFNSGDISLCNISAEDGSFIACNTGLSLGLSVTSTNIDKLNNRIYFASGNGIVSYCDLNTSTGAMTNCVNQAMGLGDLQSLKIDVTASHAYLGTISGDLFTCSVDSSNGSLSNCSLSSNLGNIIWGMALTNKRLYVARSDQIFKCDVNQATGQLSQCATTVAGFSDATAIKLNPAKTLAYVADCAANTVSTCSVSNTTGNLSNCTPSTVVFACPYRVMINHANTLAYVANYSTDDVAICSIDATTGLLTSCSTNQLGFIGPSSGDLY